MKFIIQFTGNAVDLPWCGRVQSRELRTLVVGTACSKMWWFFSLILCDCCKLYSLAGAAFHLLTSLAALESDALSNERGLRS